MVESISTSEAIAKVFASYCADKNYQVKQTEETNNLRLEISNLAMRTIVCIYHSGKIVVQGSKNYLQNEMNSLKMQILENPASVSSSSKKKVTSKACVAKYDILLESLRLKIKEALILSHNSQVTESPSPSINYRLKLTNELSSITVNQYSNGTLLLQGKTDKLFDSCCDQVEKIANPSEQQIVARFISSDETSLNEFTSRYTVDLLNLAESNVKTNLGDAYDYLEAHDQKWFMASECLRLSNIPLPEFSPLVMPASKAFEGFAKKLLIDIGLFPSGHFSSKQANFSNLNDPNHPNRKNIATNDKYADSMLKKISLCLDINRNFMMHSDASIVTKVNTQQDADAKLRVIYTETKEIFNYFNNLYNIK